MSTTILKETFHNLICQDAIFDFNMDSHYPEVNENYVPTDPLEIPHPSQDKINLMSDVHKVKSMFTSAFEDYKNEH